MGVEEFLADLGEGRLVFLDTNVFIYQMASHPVYAPLTTALLERVESGKLAALTTSVTLAELLVVPARDGDERAMLNTETILVNFPNLRVVPIDNDVARIAARVRAASGLRTPDALQLAAAEVYGADIVVTNDKRWSSMSSLRKVLLLSSYTSD